MKNSENMTRQQRRQQEREYQKSIDQRIKHIKSQKWSDNEEEGIQQMKEYLFNYYLMNLGK